jgi:hypothetical protein
MIERAAFSPTEQAVFEGNRIERFMLRRIAKTALRLPEEFPGKPSKGRGGILRVNGKRSGDELEINLNEDVGESSDDVVRFTDITIVRSPVDRSRLVDLSARRYETDEVGDRMGLTPHCETYILGAKDNSISLFSVMRAVTLAAQTVEWSGTLEYLMNADPHAPGSSFPQTF